MQRKEIYVVVEFGWDHHVNMGVFDDYIKASDYQVLLQQEKKGYNYEIEEMLLNVTPVRRQPA